MTSNALGTSEGLQLPLISFIGLRNFIVRLLLIPLVLATLLGVCGSEIEGTFPNEPITLIVNRPAEGSMDRVGRLLAGRVRSRLGVHIAVINVTGAGGITGAYLGNCPNRCDS